MDHCAPVTVALLSSSLDPIPSFTGYQAQVESLQREKAAALRECQNLEVAAAIAAQQKADVEATCADLAQAVNEHQTEVSRNEESMETSARRIQGLEATTTTLTKSGEDQAMRLRGTPPFTPLLIFR